VLKKGKKNNTLIMAAVAQQASIHSVLPEDLTGVHAEASKTKNMYITSNQGLGLRARQKSTTRPALNMIRYANFNLAFLA
jgi:hypothetical protein